LIDFIRGMPMPSSQLKRAERSIQTIRDDAAKSEVKVTPGIFALLGLAPFTPHDLRRTAATMCGNLGLSESAISLCLDHQATKGDDGHPLPAITSKVTISLLWGGSIESAKCSTHGPSSCGASLVSLWRLNCLLQPDSTFAAAPSKGQRFFCKAGGNERDRALTAQRAPLVPRQFPGVHRPPAPRQLTGDRLV
jgi:hypothetical protein